MQCHLVDRLIGNLVDLRRFVQTFVGHYVQIRGNDILVDSAAAGGNLRVNSDQTQIGSGNRNGALTTRIDAGQGNRRAPGLTNGAEMLGENFRFARIVGFPGYHKIVARALGDRSGSAGCHKELVAGCVALGVEPLGVNLPDAGVGALPGDNRSAGVDVDVRKLLVAGRGGVDGNLIAQRRGVELKAAAKNATTTAVLILAVPDDEETARGVHRHVGLALVALRGRVHQEFVARDRAVRVETTRINARHVSVLIGTGPDDHKIAVLVHGNAGEVLIAGRVLIDAKLAALGSAGGAVASGVDPIAAAVLQQARPGDHEIAVLVHGNRGKRLRTVCRRVYLKLFAETSPAGVQPLAVNPETTAVLIFRSPNHNRLAVAVDRHRRRSGLRERLLQAVDIRVHHPGDAQRHQREHLTRFQPFQDETTETRPPSLARLPGATVFPAVPDRPTASCHLPSHPENVF